MVGAKLTVGNGGPDAGEHEEESGNELGDIGLDGGGAEGVAAASECKLHHLLLFFPSLAQVKESLCRLNIQRSFAYQADVVSSFCLVSLNTHDKALMAWCPASNAHYNIMGGVKPSPQDYHMKFDHLLWLILADQPPYFAKILY